jgi:hypothetical protein
MANNFIPSNDQRFLVWLKNLINYIASGGLSRYRIPDEEFNRLKAEADAGKRLWYAARYSVIVKSLN